MGDPDILETSKYRYNYKIPTKKTDVGLTIHIFSIFPVTSLYGTTLQPYIRTNLFG